MRAPRLSRLILVAVATTFGVAAGGERAGQADVDNDLPSYVNVVAHQDDDLLFLNPDLAAPLRAGHPTVTVFLTAGQADGGYDPATGGFTIPKADFAESRNSGARAAYAAMMGVDNVWERRNVVRPTDADYELDTLVAAPQVKLIFLNVKDGGDPSDGANLTRLDEGSLAAVETFVPNNPVVTPTPQLYTKQSLIQTLRDIFTTYQPSVVRTQAPSDIHAYAGDNIDHLAAARFTNQAIATYHGPGGNGRVLLEHYRDYATANLPDNLSFTHRTDKRDTFLTYAEFDSNVTHFLATDPNSAYPVWPQRQYMRWPHGSAWTATDSDGRLEAFAVEDNRVVRWYQTAPGGSWTGPEALPAASGTLAPQLSIARNTDGRLQVVAMRYGPGTSEVISATQTSPGSSFGAWTSLGNPNGGEDHTGIPAVTANADGRLAMFVKNKYGGISAKFQSAPGAAFAAQWHDLGGGMGIQDGLAVAPDRSGRIHLFATRCDVPPGADMSRVPCWLAHWSQQSPNGTGVWDTPRWVLGGISDQPSIGRNQDGRLAVFFRQAGGSDVKTVFENPDGTWNMSSTNFSGNGGVGSVAVTTNTGPDGRIFVFQRDNNSGVSVTRQVAANDVLSTSWTALGGLIERLPSANIDATGRVVLMTLGTDGRLYLKRQQNPGDAIDFGAWQPIGS